MSDGVITPRKKESVDAVESCTLGKVCNWNTADDSEQSHESEEKREQRMHKLLLKLIHLNSDAMGSVQHINVETLNKGRKSVAS